MEVETLKMFVCRGKPIKNIQNVYTQWPVFWPKIDNYFFGWEIIINQLAEIVENNFRFNVH